MNMNFIITKIENVIYVDKNALTYFSLFSSFFLNYGLNIWTMTPSTFTSGEARAVSMQLSGELVEAPVTRIYYALPVISLKNTTLISTGDGTKTAPFRVKVS